MLTSSSSCFRERSKFKPPTEFDGSREQWISTRPPLYKPAFESIEALLEETNRRLLTWTCLVHSIFFILSGSIGSSDYLQTFTFRAEKSSQQLLGFEEIQETWNAPSIQGQMRANSINRDGAFSLISCSLSIYRQAYDRRPVRDSESLSLSRLLSYYPLLNQSL